MQNEETLARFGDSTNERAWPRSTTRTLRLSSPLLSSMLALAGGLLLGCPGQVDDGPDPMGPVDGDRALLVDGGLPSASASGGDAATASPWQDEWLSNEAVLALLRDGKYRGEGFRPINREPFPSTVSPQKTIALWISEAGYDAYTKVSPDRVGSNVALPVGTVIVREVLNEAALETITVMMRLPDGAFPLGGNWWYASATPDGTIRANAQDGTPVIGLLESCGTCHLRRSNDDYLFGAPAGY